MSLRAGLTLAVVLATAAPAFGQSLDPIEQPNLKIEGWQAGVSNVLDMAFLPDGRAVICQQPGDLAIRTKDGMLIKSAIHVPVKPLTATEQGLLGVAVDPDFATNHTIYLHASVGDTVADKNQVIRATITDDNKVTLDLANPLFKYESPEKHNGSMMIIHKGFLYMGIGDSGADASPPTIRYPSCLNKPNGKILRMALDGSAPADNPLSNLTMVTGCTTDARISGAYTMQPPEKRIWAWGFRQPYRFWIDPVTDLVWLGDVGEKTFEEIDIVGKGQHFGYPFEEGTKKWNQPFMPAGSCKGMVPGTDCVPPAFEYATDSGGDGCALGGFILDACGWPDSYKNRYLYGDFNAGRIYTVQVTPDRKGIVPNSRRSFGNMRTLNGFRLGPDGAVYVMGFQANAIWRVLPKTPTMNCAVSPPDGGVPGSVDAGVMAGGVDAAAGGGGSGGSGGAGGDSGSGGDMGGTGGAGGRAGSGGTGGTGGTGDEPGSGGESGGGPPKSTTSNGGCTCMMGGQPSAGGIFVLTLLALVAIRRRR